MSKHTVRMMLIGCLVLVLMTACGYIPTGSSSVSEDRSDSSSSGSSGGGSTSSDEAPSESSSRSPFVYAEPYMVSPGGSVTIYFEDFLPGIVVDFAIYRVETNEGGMSRSIAIDDDGFAAYELQTDANDPEGAYVIYAWSDDSPEVEGYFEIAGSSGSSTTGSGSTGGGDSRADHPSRDPILGVEPESGPRGTEHFIIFEGFAPGEFVEFVVVDSDGREVYGDAIELDGDGTGIYSLLSEDGDPVGWYTIYAYGEVSSAEASFQITGSSEPSNPNPIPNPNPQPAPNPLLSISPTSGGQTTQFDLTLSGFRPNEQVVVYVISQESGAEEFFFEIEIDGSGRGSGWLRTGTDNPSGYYFIAAEGDQGSYADGEIYVEAASQTSQVSYDEALNIVAQAVHSYWAIEFQRRGWGPQNYDVPELEEYIAPASVCRGLAPEDTKNNAFYCGYENKIAWDRALMYSEWEDYGAVGISVTLGHEYGHLVMDQTGNVPNYYVDKDGDGVRDMVEMQVQEELLADCLAGAFLNHAVNTGLFIYEEALGAVDLIYTFGGRAGSFVWHDPDFHGTPQFRAQMLAGGLDGGLDWCLYGSD